MGSPRSGSTWLLRMLSHHERVIPIDEPKFGNHLAPLEDADRTLNASHTASSDYFLSPEYEETWRPLLRTLVLKRLGTQVERIANARHIDRPVVVLKEPNSSHGADLIMSLVPASRLVFLLRDGRDVIDSLVDATSGDTWLGAFGERDERSRLEFIRHRTRLWLYNTTKVQDAFAAHAPERRLMIRYEDLLADPLTTLRGLLQWTNLTTSEDQLRAMVSSESFASIPAEQRGSGRFFRAATPGLWRENMSPAEQELMTELMGDKLAELGYPA